ncbi:MAG: hypothetical protein AB1679_09710 [Actinomycetota bacterium]|jgi:hypothetical protein
MTAAATHPPMRPVVQWAVAIWLMLTALVTFVGLVWIWPIALELSAEGAQPQRIRWLGPDFKATAMTSLILVVALSAVAGSVVQLITVFTLRAGKGTLERGYEAWYFLRPLAAALVGIVFFLAVYAGLMTIGEPGQESLPVYATSGALAGLFTDRVLQRLQSLLGATNPDAPGSTQQVPAFQG